VTDRVDHLVRKLLVRIGARPRTRRLVLWMAAFLHEMDRNGILVRAATLVYPTLLSIVPVLAVGFAVMDLVGGDAATRVANLAMGLFFADAVSPVGRQLEAMLSGVNFTGLGIVGLAGVLVTSAGVYFRVEKTYNTLWNARSQRSWPVRATMFYTTLTLAPLLLVWGFHYSDVISARRGGEWVAYLTPVLVTAVAFIAPIRMIPDTKVEWIPALIGGIVSASLFEVTKLGFTAYVTIFGAADTVTRIYGSLGLFPVFLVWLFLVWVVVLLGVELAYCIQRRDDIVASEELRQHIQGHGYHHADALFGLQCLLAVAQQYLAGGGPTPEAVVTRRLESDPRFVKDALETLESDGFLVEASTGYVPAVPLEGLTLREVLTRYRERTRPQSSAQAPGSALLARLFAPDVECLDVSIATLAWPSLPGPEVTPIVVPIVSSAAQA